MANTLGYLKENDAGYVGRLTMIDLSTPIRIVKNEDKSAKNHPDFRVFAGQNGVDVGAAWYRKAKSTGKQTLFVTLASPTFGSHRIYANLAPVKGRDGRHVLLWNAKK